MRLLLLPLALAVAVPVAAQSIPTAEYAARRDSLAARLDSGVVVAFGGRTPVTPERFVQLPAFRYLTGILEPDAALLVVVRDGRPRATLYTSARDPRRAPRLIHFRGRCRSTADSPAVPNRSRRFG